VRLFGVHQRFEQLFGGRVGVGGRLGGELVVGLHGPLFHLGGQLEDLLRIVDLRDRTGGDHLHVAFEKEDSLGQRLDMRHFHDGDSPEEGGQRPEALIGQVKMPVHVLMDGLEFIGD